MNENNMGTFPNNDIEDKKKERYRIILRVWNCLGINLKHVK